MSRREAHLEFHTSQTQNLSLIKIDRRFGTGIDVEAEDCASTSGPPQHVIVRVQGHQGQWIQRVGDRACAAEVVEVRMGVPEMSNPPTAFLRLCQNDLT